MAEQTRRRRYEQRLEALRGEYISQEWRAHHQELAEFIVPRRARFFREQTNRGHKAQAKIVNSTATKSVRVLRAGMMSGLTSPARPWFKLGSPDADLNRYGPVKKWLADVQHEMERVFAQSNLYNVLPSLYEAAAVLGVACAFEWDDVIEDPDQTGQAETLVRFEEAPVGSFFIATSPRGYVDTIYRELRMTVRQLVTKFGRERCSPAVQSSYDRNDGEAWIDVVHVVEPNELPRSPFARYKRFASCWYEASRGGDDMLRESGFDEFPGLVPRWYVVGNNVYGDSQGMEVLPDVKQLQVQERRKLEVTEFNVNPPRTASKDVSGKVSLIPGGVTVADAIDARQAMAVPFVPAINLADLRADIAQVEARIQSGLFEDLFLMLTNVDREVTAFEVAARQEEKLLMLGPVIERLTDELLDPLIDRTFAIMQRRGRFAKGSALEPPRELAGVDLSIQYVSILAQAQRAVGTAAMDRLAQRFAFIAPLRPDVLDNWDVDKDVRDYAERLGTTPDAMRSEEATEAERETRVQAQRAAAMAEAAPGVAGAVKDLSEADLSNTNSAASRALQAVGAT